MQGEKRLPEKTRGDHSRYRIGTVAKLTGLSTHTIRIWERRYSAVVAQRDERGRRHYGSDDVERLTLLKAVTERGRPIRLIANLDAAELMNQLERLDGHARARQSLAADLPLRPLRIAVLGEFLPQRLAAEADADLNLLVADADQNRFRADVKELKPDAIVLELATVDSATAALVDELKKCAGAGVVLVVYSYGREADISLAQKKATLLRSPVSAEDLKRTLGLFERREAGVADSPEPRTDAALTAFREVPPRRYSRSQLARLAVLSPEIQCECPRHLAELVRSLSDFETYSQQCEDRNKEDAALHAWLHGIAAQARALVETGLGRVVEVEGLEKMLDDE